MFKVNNKDLIKTSMMSLWCLYCYHLIYFTYFSSVSIVDSEQINNCWDPSVGKYLFKVSYKDIKTASKEALLVGFWLNFKMCFPKRFVYYFGFLNAYLEECFK